MMKPKRLQSNKSSSLQTVGSNSGEDNKENEVRRLYLILIQNVNIPAAESRLARGERVKVDKKEMLKMTKKNYDELPEVKQRKQEETRKQEYKERMKKVKENESKRRQMARNK